MRIDFLKKEIIPCHPLIQVFDLLDRKNLLDDLYRIIDGENSDMADKYKREDIDYYLNKYLNYKKCGYFSFFKKREALEYDELVIKESLCNINNIVFEVTDACNLNCAYCTYGNMYYDYDPRKNQMMGFDTVKTVFDFFIPLWNSHSNKSSSKITTVGFYGEPLLNFELIEKSVLFCNRLNLSNRIFKYTMTTNATLIDRHISFLVKNDFHITISLDGSKQNQSYRVFHNGKNSFDRVFRNIKLIREKYPDFFETNVSFNSVLHNRNSVEEIHKFIFNEFGKVPQISSVNNYGIKPEMINEFKSMFILYHDSLGGNDSQLISERFTNDPNVFRLCQFLLWYSSSQFFDYESFLYVKDQLPRAINGTCVPFSRKMFITVNKKIMVCERVDFKYSWGIVDDGKVNLDLDYIADKYNRYYKKMFKQCHDCYMINGCHQCIFQLENLDSTPHCYGYKSEKQMIDYIKTYIDMLENRNIPFEELFNDVVFS